MYSWHDVASRTLAVYSHVLQLPKRDDSLLYRLRRHHSSGTWAGPLFCIIILLLHFCWRVAEWLQAAEGVDIAPDWPTVDELLAAGAQGQAGHKQQQRRRQQQHEK
jgi:hypothetical protein